jgi:sugar transferase EpsL
VSAKRLFDLLVLLPLLPLIAAAIGVLAIIGLVAHGRPVFFTQVRVGLRGRPFRVHKLRTMTSERDPAARRSTRWGGWLRRRGLDEGPQLWDVLRGQMSLVGPRPLMARDADRFIAAHPPFAQRYRVKPGLTGLSEIHGARGPVDVAALDAEYVRPRPPGARALLDVKILLRTVWITIVGKQRGFLRSRTPVVGAVGVQ